MPSNVALSLESSASSLNAISERSSSNTEAVLTAWLQGLAPTSRRAYRSDLAHLARWAGSESDRPELAAVSLLLSVSKGPARVMLERWVSESDGAPRTRLRRLGAVRSFLRFCSESEIGGPGVVPVRHRVHPPPPGKDAPSPLLIARTLRTLDQKSDLLSIRDAAILGVLAATFIRRSELARLQRGDVNLTGRTLEVERKGGHRQRLRLPAIAVRRVERWLADAPWPAAAPGPLWGAMAKHGCSVVRRGISANAPYQICRRYGLPPPHSWRHLGAQWALQDGRGAGVPASVSELQSLLGHRGTTATVHYVQRSTDTAAELRERWSDYLEGLD